MTGTDLAVGQCVCGLDIPDTSPSDWACSEPCQSAWLMHQADPDYPHPRDIRARARARAAHPERAPDGSMYPSERLGMMVGPPRVPDGTEIDVDGAGYVRVGSSWQQTGPWSLLTGDMVEVLAYLRWCPTPTCRIRRPSRIITGRSGHVQVCAACGHPWQGRPLFGFVEDRGEPWPGVRLRVTDGFRSAAHVFTKQWLERMTTGAGRTAAAVPMVMDRHWTGLERALAGGYADQDMVGDRLRARARARVWDWVFSGSDPGPRECRISDGGSVT